MTNTLYSTKAISYQVKDSLLAGNNSIWANRSLTKNLVSQSAKIYANQAILATNGGWDKGKHSKRGEFTPFAKGDLSHLSKEADYPHWQDLRVTNSYEQKKKDSVQAVLIQLHSVEQVTRLPNNIGLPDYIGLVKYCQSSIGGWDLMCVRLTYAVQPFGSMPLDCSSLRAKSLNQLPKLIPSSLANFDNCSLNSGWMRIWKAGALPSPFGLLSLFIVDMCVPIEIVSNVLGTHLNMGKPNKTMPRSALTLTGHLTTTDRLSIEEAMKDHITPVTGRNSFTPNIKFKWRFFSCQQSKYFSVEATSEQEARSLLPDSPCLFSARIRKEVAHG